jgi:hypothetical protein
MSNSAKPISLFADFNPSRGLRWAVVAAALTSFVAPAASEASTRTGAVRAGTYDGVWNVLFATRAGNCSSTNSVPFTVAGTRVSSAGGGKVTGGIGRGGVVSVNISVGASKASGSGRLLGSTGTGRWSGIIQGDRCSGTWQATRS